MSSPDAEVDGSVCYRHPDRTSWTLCQRCGRTICPECQILTPGGVRCPDCVRETGGSVRWEPAARRPAAKAKKTGMRAAAAAAALDAGVRDIRRPGRCVTIGDRRHRRWCSGSPGFATANAPCVALAAIPEPAHGQVWRYFTAAFVYPSVGDGASSSASS